MTLTPFEKALIKLHRVTKYGSIETHYKDEKPLWVDKHRRYSPDALIEAMDLTDFDSTDII